MRDVRQGFTVHEMIISLTIMSVVFAIATHFAVQQLRFFRGVAGASAARSQLEQATELMRNVLWSVSPGSGDVLVAQDSAIEVHLAIGTAVTCASSPGVLVIPGSAPAGNTLSSFIRVPEPGDRVSALFSDSLGATWLMLRVSSAEPGGSCVMFSTASGSHTIAIAEPVAVPPGTALRFTRPLRLSLYRSSDDRWYVGARDWNGERAQFNAIQPVAGPLASHAGDSESGLRFIYHDRDGAELREPVDASRIAVVTVSARTTGAHRDSAVAVIRLRNAR